MNELDKELEKILIGYFGLKGSTAKKVLREAVIKDLKLAFSRYGYKIYFSDEVTDMYDLHDPDQAEAYKEKLKEQGNE